MKQFGHTTISDCYLGKKKRARTRNDHVLLFSLSIVLFKLGGSPSQPITNRTTVHPRAQFTLGVDCGFFAAIHHFSSLKSRLLLPPFRRHRCSVSRYPTDLRSATARLTVDLESARSAEPFSVDGAAEAEKLFQLGIQKGVEAAHGVERTDSIACSPPS